MWGVMLHRPRSVWTKADQDEAFKRLAAAAVINLPRASLCTFGVLVVFNSAALPVCAFLAGGGVCSCVELVVVI